MFRVYLASMTLTDAGRGALHCRARPARLDTDARPGLRRGHRELPGDGTICFRINHKAEVSCLNLDVCRRRKHLRRSPVDYPIGLAEDRSQRYLRRE